MLTQFQWYRRLRGGRWAKVTGFLWGHRWITSPCIRLTECDEHWADIAIKNRDWHDPEFVKKVASVILK